MGRVSNRFTPIFLLVGSLAFLATVIRVTTFIAARFSANLTGQHKKESRPVSPTADQHKMNTSDRAIAQKIRRGVIGDKSLSTYTHNVNSVAQDGKVTLRGPVRCDGENHSVEAKTTAVVGEGNVTSKIEIAPSK